MTHARLMDAYFVVGMHRSGTSATMAVLFFLGVDIGYEWTRRTWGPFNEKGYFENPAFLSFEREVLKKANGSWNQIPEERHIYDVFPEMRPKLHKLIETFSSEKWGYKGVRWSLFPETLTEIPKLHLIVTLRSPLAVAKSLKRRDGFEHSKSFELYSAYYYRIFKLLSRHPEIPFIIVNYDDLVDKTEPTVKKIASFLGIVPTEKQINFFNDFIEKRLRHF